MATGPYSSAAALSTAILQRLLHGFTKTNAGLQWARVQYTGSAWAVVAGTDSNKLVSGNFVWSTNKLTVAISGHDNVPCVFVSRAINGAHLVAATATSTSNIDVFFEDFAGADVTTEDTSMDFYIAVLGE